MRFLIGIIIVAVVSLSVTLAAMAGSIWEKAPRQVKSMYIDDVARNVGDILTIVISESSNITDSGTRLMDKKTTHTANMDGNITINPGFIHDKIFWFPTNLNYDLPSIGVTGASENKQDNKANYTSTRLLTDSVTVTIEDVMPNNNLVVLGKRRRGFHGDEELIQISGIVRPSDITYTNTVNSNQVAEFTILMTKKGQENYFLDPGWLMKRLNAINPF